MNSISRKKSSKNNTFISSIIMDSIIKKKNSIYYSNIIYPSLLLGSPNDLNDFSPKSFSEKSPNCNTPNNYENIKTMDSIQSTNSFESISTDISDNNSPNNNAANNIITKAIIKKIYSHESDSEIITDTNTILKINSEKKEKKNIVEAPILKSLSAKNIYDKNSDDFLVISNLILLSKLEPNQKLFINYRENQNKFSKISFELKIDDSYIQKLSRWYYSQSRNETLLALQKLFEVSIQQFNFHKDIKNNVEIKKYLNLFKNSLLGLNNLKITYSKDEEILKEIDIVIEKLENIINTK